MEETITDEIIEQAAVDIKEILKDKKLTYRDRKMFEVLSYFVIFLGTDHKKINQIEKRSIGLWISRNPKLVKVYGSIIVALAFFLSNLWFVSGFRKPFVHAVIKNLFGVDLSYDLIP